MSTGQTVLLLAGIGGALWVLHWVGRAVTKVLEAAAAVAVVFVTAWLLIKYTWKGGKWLVKHWRTTLTTAALLAWLYWWGWPSLLITAGAVGVGLAGWWWLGRSSFEPAAGVVAALDPLRPQDARLATRRWPDGRRPRAVGHGAGLAVPALGGATKGATAIGSAAQGDRGPVRALVG
jgi:hypothetical protein